MSDIVNAFKQKSSRKRANWQSEDTNPIQELQLKRQDNTVQQETQENKALKASQQQNVQQDTDTSYSQKLAALQEAAAAEQARNAANAAAQQQAQQQTQQTQQVVKQDNEGWKKYYDSEKQKVREQASKANAFDTFLQDLFNSGWDTRLAETQARNKYAQKMLRQSTDDSGNVTDQNKLNKVIQFTNYNADVAKANSDYEKARGNMIGATAQNKDQNMFKSTANAIRNMDVGSAILGSRDVEGTEGAKSNNIKDAGRFLLNLLPGMANAPTTGLTNLSEALSGKGTNYETGLEEDLDTLSRVGRGVSGAIEAAGVFFGGSKDLVKSTANALFKRGANEAVKQATKQTTKGAIKELTKAMLQEGGEEATQQVAEFFGNGGKLITSDGQFDQESFNDLVKETAQAGALGAVGGGIFHGTAKGIDALRNKTKVPKAPNAGVAESSDISNINNQKISAQTRNEKAAEQLRNLEGSVVENTTEKTDTKVNKPVDITEKTYQPSEMLTSAISKINEVQKSQSNLPQNTINDINTQVQNISEQIRNGEITEEDGIRMIEELKTSLQTTTENNVVEPQETSATGQKVNPQDVSNVVTEAQGTQANQTPADVKTDVTENTPKLSEKMSEPSETITPEQEINNLIETAATQEQQSDVRLNKYNEKFNEGKAIFDELMNPEIQKKIQQANLTMQNGVADLSTLTDAEMSNYRKTLEILKDAGAIGEFTVDENMKKAWLPQFYSDTNFYANTFQELLDTGRLENTSMNRRTGEVAASGNMGFTNDALANLYARASMGDEAYVEAASGLADDLGIKSTPEQLQNAGQVVKEFVSKINKTSDGSKKNTELFIEEVKKINTYSDGNRIGEALGNRMTINNTNAQGISDFEVANSSNNLWENACLGVKKGISAFANSTSESVDNLILNGTTIKDTNGNEHRVNFSFLSKKQRNSIVGLRDKIFESNMNKYGDAEYANMKTNLTLINYAWKSNFINMSMRVKYSDARINKVLNENGTINFVNDRLVMTTAQKASSIVHRTMNSAFRGLRLQTTLNEIPEIVKSWGDFGKMGLAKPKEISHYINKYGFGDGNITEQFLNQLPKEQRAELELSLEQTNDPKEVASIYQKFMKAFDTVDNFTQWNQWVQSVKDATYLKNAEAYWSSKGLEGPALTAQVLQDYGQRMLPMDRFYKYLKNDSALNKVLTMYMDSGFRLTSQSLKGAVGSNTAGANLSRNRAQRIAVNAATDLLPRAISAFAMGVPISAVMGLVNIGLDDYSGIDDEDKNILDHIMNDLLANFPPLNPLVSAYNVNRQNEIGEAKANESGYDYQGKDVLEETLNKVRKTFTPLGSWLDQQFGYGGNRNNLKDVAERGYAENAQGKVQYLAPDNLIDWVTALIAGVNKTSNAREYQKNPDLISALVNENITLDDLVNYNQALNSAPLDLNLKKEEDYNRPLSATEYDDYSTNYSQKVKEALDNKDRKSAEEWYRKGQEYNAIVDDLRTNHPEAYQAYQESKSSNIVSPKKWSLIAYGDTKEKGETIDLTVWNAIKQMEQIRKRDFDAKIDPAYELEDPERERRFLQYMSTATGEDMGMKNEMVIDDFWKDFFNTRKEFYDAKTESDYNTKNKDQSVINWNNLNDEYGDLMSFVSGKSDKISNEQRWLELSLTYPTLAEYASLKSALQAKYGDDYNKSQEYDNFFEINGDNYSAESDAFNNQVRNIINAMREIEGFDALTEEQYSAISKIGRDSSSYSSSSKKKSSRSSSSGGYSYAPSFENTFQATPVYAKNYSTKKSVKAKKAGKANFENVSLSGTSGTEPYAAV